MEMDGKTVIVTGANNGLGKETARELARRGARVIMACRNMDTGKQAREEIMQSTENKNVVLRHIDLTSFQSIRTFADDINKTESNLHVLIHNAGVCLPRTHTVNGIELTMATNHFGPFLLTHLLIDLLKRSAPSRIIVVASCLHHFGKLNFQNLIYQPSLIPQMNYFNSKLANVSFTKELSRRLKGTDVTANCLHPGLIYTEIWDASPVPFSWFLKLFRKIIFKSTVEGTETIMYLATSDEVARVSGKYFVNRNIAYMCRRGSGVNAARKLWEKSAKIVNLCESDPRI